MEIVAICVYDVHLSIILPTAHSILPQPVQGPHEIAIRCFDHSGQYVQPRFCIDAFYFIFVRNTLHLFRFLGVGAAVSFEISSFAPPASILPLPHGAYGVLSPPLPPELSTISKIPELIRPKIFENQQRCVAQSSRSHLARNTAESFTFLIWEPWGVPARFCTNSIHH